MPIKTLFIRASIICVVKEIYMIIGIVQKETLLVFLFRRVISLLNFSLKLLFHVVKVIEGVSITSGLHGLFCGGDPLVLALLFVPTLKRVLLLQLLLGGWPALVLFLQHKNWIKGYRILCFYFFQHWCFLQLHVRCFLQLHDRCAQK